MRLIITRHGETEENVQGICQGQLPGKLTEKGKEQARKLAERLKREKFDVIFSSDLTRVADTAKEIVKFHPDVPIYFVEELRERFQGSLQGKRRGLEVPGWEKEENRARIRKEAGCETIEALCGRGKKFIEGLLCKNKNKNILVIGHAGTNHAIFSMIMEQSWKDTWEKQQPKNTSVTIFEFDEDKKPKLVLFNCTKHLEDIN